MANLAQFDLQKGGHEARIRALLEDLTEYHSGVYPQHRLALALWFRKALDTPEQYMLELFSGLPKEGFVDSHFSLLWKTGSQAPPFVNLRTASVDFFSKLIGAHPQELDLYRDRFEVIYFDKQLVSKDILDAFNVVTDPPGLAKGWYVSGIEYEKPRKHIQALLSLHGNTRPAIGLVKMDESPDFEYCRGVLHVEINGKWLPLSSDGIRAYSYFNDLQSGQSVYFLFEGGALYQLLKFEVKSAPEYAGRLLGRTPDDRYPEVYLRAVHPAAEPAA